jgi:hypothetical protein
LARAKELGLWLSLWLIPGCRESLGTEKLGSHSRAPSKKTGLQFSIQLGIALIIAPTPERQLRICGRMRVWKELPLGKRWAGHTHMPGLSLTFPPVIQAGEYAWRRFGYAARQIYDPLYSRRPLVVPGKDHSERGAFLR